MDQEKPRDRYLIRNARIVKPARLLTGDIAIEDGVISYIGEPRENTSDYVLIDGTDQYVLPGFVDIHCHGGVGFDFTSGPYDTAKNCFDPSVSDYQSHLGRVMAHFAAHGVTKVLLSTIAAPLERLEAVLNEMATYIASDRNGRDGAVLLGAFIEGSFIRHAEFSGAQNPDYFLKPSIEIFERFNKAAGGNVRYINIVPEHGRAALELTEYATQQGVLVGAGHTSCSSETYRQAVQRGLRVAVHFTNGPTGSSFKPFGGGSVLQSVLTSRRVLAELIADGYHVNPAYLLDILHRKGTDRIIAVSDAMFLAGAADIEEFEVSGIKGRTSENREYLEVVDKENTLFGSVLTMDVAFSNWLSWLTREMRGIWFNDHLPYEPDEALRVASKLCSANPAKALGALDPASRHLGMSLEDYFGTLTVGKRADIAMIRLHGHDGGYEAEVAETFVGGRRVLNGEFTS